MPHPTLYEKVIGLHSGLLNVTYNQLETYHREKFSPCLGFGGIYIPLFADSKTAVSGQLINMTPRFLNSIPVDLEHLRFNWSM